MRSIYAWSLFSYATLVCSKNLFILNIHTDTQKLWSWLPYLTLEFVFVDVCDLNCIKLHNNAHHKENYMLIVICGILLKSLSIIRWKKNTLFIYRKRITIFKSTDLNLYRTYCIMFKLQILNWRWTRSGPRGK